MPSMKKTITRVEKICKNFFSGNESNEDVREVTGRVRTALLAAKLARRIARASGDDALDWLTDQVVADLETIRELMGR